MVSLKEFLGEEAYKKLVSKLKRSGGSFDTIAYIVTPDKIIKAKVPESAKFGDTIGADKMIIGIGKGRAEESIENVKKNTFGYGDAVNRILSYLTMNRLIEKADEGTIIDEDNNTWLFIAYVPNDPRLKVNDKGNISFNATVSEKVSESGWISIHVDPKILRLEELNEDMLAGKFVVVLGRIFENEGNDGRKFRHCMAYGLMIAE